jgi:predicted ArsR family transcriptional regulator
MTNLRPDHELLLAALRERGPLTDEQLTDVTGLRIQTASPRRNDLVRRGLVRQAGTAVTTRGRSAKTWCVVPEDEVAAQREAAASRKPRNKDITKQPLEWKLEAVRQLLNDEAVNAAVRDKHGRAWQRVRGRARDRDSERQQELRQLRNQMRDADNARSRLLDFLKTKRHLLESAEIVRGLGRFIDDDLERHGGVEPMKIPTSAWPEVVDLLEDLVDVASQTVVAINAKLGRLGDDVIEGHAIEVDQFFELPEAAGEVFR